MAFRGVPLVFLAAKEAPEIDWSGCEDVAAWLLQMYQMGFTKAVYRNPVTGQEKDASILLKWAGLD